jgi:hypothetical protein
MDDCYHLETEFAKIQFQHNYHESNSVAHELARLARGSEQHVRLDDPPMSIIPLFIKAATYVTSE